MNNKKREIFIRVENISQIIRFMENIKKREEILSSNFRDYEILSKEENKIFENWPNYLDEINQKLNHITL